MCTTGAFTFQRADVVSVKMTLRGGVGLLPERVNVFALSDVGAETCDMSTPPLPIDRLADLLDWDEQSYDVHFAAMDRLFQSLGNPDEIIATARMWWADPDEAVRALGFDLLAVPALHFSWHVAPLIEAAQALALDAVGEDLRWSAAHALGTICDDDRVLFPLLRFAADTDSGVRWQVVRGIPVGVDPLPDESVKVLLRLMRDPDDSVRDWATMMLGSRENDTAEIRDAFVERLDDTGEDTAGEAAVALAKRHDPRVLGVLERELADQDVGNLYVEAAAELGDPRLLPLLKQLKDRHWQDDDPRPYLLDDALTACGGISPSTADDGLRQPGAAHFRPAEADHGL